MTNSQKRMESYRISRENEGKNEFTKTVKRRLKLYVLYANLRERLGLGCLRTVRFRILEVYQVCDYF